MFNPNNYLTEVGEYQAGIQERHNAYEGMVTRIQSRAQQSKNRRIASLGLEAQNEGNKMLESIGIAEAAPAIKTFVGNSVGKIINPHLRPVVEGISRGARSVAAEVTEAGTELGQTVGAMAADTAVGVRAAAGDIATGVRAAGQRAVAQMAGGVTSGEGQELAGGRTKSVRFGQGRPTETEYAGSGQDLGGGGTPRGLTTSDYGGSGKPMTGGANMENSSGGLATKYTEGDRAAQDANQVMGGGGQDTTAAARSRTLSKAGAKAGRGVAGDDIATPAVTDATEAAGEAGTLVGTEETLGEVAATNIEDPIGWLAGIAAGIVGIVGAISGAGAEAKDKAKAAVIANAPAPIPPPPQSSAGRGAVVGQSSALSRTY